MTRTECTFVDCSPDTIGGLFTSFKREAFRLELLQTYEIEEERESLTQFRANPWREFPDDSVSEWCDEIWAGAVPGKRYRRVRQVIVPPCEYVRFEVATGFRFSIPAGEDVRVVLGERPIVFANSVPLLTDFWVFDDERCILLRYNHNGQFLTFSEVLPEHLKPYLMLKAEAESRSTPLVETLLWKDVILRENK